MTGTIRTFVSLRGSIQYGWCLAVHGAAAVDNLAADV